MQPNDNSWASESHVTPLRIHDRISSIVSCNITVLCHEDALDQGQPQLLLQLVAELGVCSSMEGARLYTPQTICSQASATCLARQSCAAPEILMISRGLPFTWVKADALTGTPLHLASIICKWVESSVHHFFQVTDILVANGFLDLFGMTLTAQLSKRS